MHSFQGIFPHGELFDYVVMVPHPTTPSVCSISSLLLSPAKRQVLAKLHITLDYNTVKKRMSSLSLPLALTHSLTLI